MVELSRRKDSGALGERGGAGDLIRGCLAGEAGAQAQLYAAHRGRVAAALYRILGERGELEDLIQEVFVEAFRSLAELREGDRLSSWLQRITVAVAAGALRRRRRRPAVDDRGEAGAIYAALARLSPKKRLVFHLREIEGRELGEVAYLTGSNLMTARARLYCARRELYAVVAGGSSRHVRPQLWAERAAGRLPRGRAQVIEQHAGGCERCRAQQRRVESAIAAFDEIAGAEIDDLGWDHIGARIYWARSLEQRSGEPAARRAPPRSRALVLGAVAAVIAVAATAAIWWSRPDPVALLAAPPRAPEPIGETLAVELAPVSSLAAVAILGRGEVEIDGAPPAWDRPIEAGARIETGDGEAILQLGRDRGFAVAAGSKLVLRSLDSQLIELVLETGAIEVVAGEPSQTLAVVAGGRSVLARGGAFRVRRAGAELAIVCVRGEVEVTDGVSSRSIEAGRRLALSVAGDLAGGVETDAHDGGGAPMPLLPIWTDARAALASSTTVAVEAERGARIEVDGVELGAGAMTIRLTAGRHLIAVGDHPEWGRGKWLVARAGEVTPVLATPGR